METLKKINVVNDQGESLGVYAILVTEDMASTLEKILPYLVPSLEADGSIKNIQIASPKNINIEPLKGVKFKVGNKGQIELIPDKTGDLREFVLKAWRSVEVGEDGKTPVMADGDYVDLADEILVRLKTYCTELELNSYDKVETSRKNVKIKFKNKDAWQKGVIEGASHDIRAYSTGKGSGGGIAVQIASTDSDGKENKFKIETDRIVDVDDEAVAPTKNSFEGSGYCGEGGKGIEVGTINSQMTSLYTKTYRFKGNAPIFGVTRGSIVTDPTTGKKDYPTQDDDSKDIISDDDPITWNDVIAAVKYLKAQGNI